MFLNRWYIRYGLALAAAGAAMLARLAVEHLAGPGLPTYITFYPMVMFTALWGGFLPGIVTTVASALLVDYFVLTPVGSLFKYDIAIDWVGMAIFLGMGALMSTVAGRLRYMRTHLKDLVEQQTAKLKQEIIEHKKDEAALREKSDDLARSNKDLEQFAYVASHDLQEPLRAVAGFMGLLKKQYDSKLDDEAREYIHFAVEGAERMQKLIHDLLAFSRIGSKGAQFCPVPLKNAVEAALLLLRAAIDESGVSVVYGELPTVYADASQLTQLMQNLIGNAIKFRAGIRPMVKIDARKNNDAWEISVADNGIGIDPRYFDRIFLIFQRLHSRTEYPGTGIGLALCKKIVERHGGVIRVESQPGQGATFYFTIPDKGGSS